MDKKIKILPCGPYEVSGDVPLKKAVIEMDRQGASESWSEGKEYPHPEKYYLCRCGQSKNKPFCDGAHVKAEFKGREQASKEPYVEGCEVYEGEVLDMLDNENLCASMRFCDIGLGAWDYAAQSVNKHNREIAMQECANCASGRLTLRDKEGNLIEPNLEKEIAPIEDTYFGVRGPLWVKGGIELEGSGGEKYEVRNRMTLCRCGESKNMPYCDISHLNCPHMKGFDK